MSRRGTLATAAAQCVAALFVLALLSAAPAGAAGPFGLPESPRVAIRGVEGPGPGALDRVWVRGYGPARADCVMVMVPGSPAGQGGFAWVARDIVERVDGLAVWALDRRSNGLEDTAPFASGTADEAFAYYFGGAAFGGRTFAPVSAEDAGYARRWGAAVTLGDLRRVVKKAGRGGRCVILGGHSFGAAEVPAYAVWDFGGRPGFRDLDGLVMVDGGLMNAFGSVVSENGFPPFESVDEAQAALDALEAGSPFNSDEGGGAPEWQVGVVPELVCRYALAAPDAPSGMQSNGFGDFILTDPPAFAVTNEAFAGLFNDQALGVQGARLGRLAESGEPRPWIDGPHSSVARFCATFAQEPGNGMEWYFPARLELDLIQGMESMRPTPVTRFLGLRPRHLHRVDTPLYVLETQLTDGGVLRAARKFTRASRIEDPTLVNAANMRHYDPLMDAPPGNRFVKSVVPFLERLVRDVRDDARRGGASADEP